MGRTLAFGVSLILMACAWVAAAIADEHRLSSGWLLGLELQERTFDTMSAGDARPNPRGDTGVRVSLDWLAARHWGLGVSGHFGGTWFDWSDPIYNTVGKIEDAAWDVRGGVDRVLPVGTRAIALVGAGFEYGEAHSWLRNLTDPYTPGAQDISDEGPRCYRTGGFVRAAVAAPVWRRLALSAEVSGSVYGAHASDPPFGTQYNWLGRSLAVSVGLRFQLARGHESGP